jgi:hypothetical protein
MTVSERSVGFLTTGALVVILGACGGASDGGADEPATSSSPSASSPSYDPQQQRIDDATANLTDFFSVYAPLGKGEYFTRPEAECIAEEVVQDPGLRRLQKAGVLNDELQYVIDADPTFSRRDAVAVTDAVFGCSDAADLLRKEAVSDVDATAEQKRCAEDALSDDLLSDLFVLALRKEPLDPAVRQVAQAFAPCRDA